MKDFLRMMTSLLLVLFMVWLLFTFFLGIKMAPNDDMSPRIDAGDISIFYRINRSPVLQDVVVLEKNDTGYFGRVVAVPGDEVEITEKGALIINGNQRFEDKIYSDTVLYEGFVTYPLKLSSDEYFVLVDKRNGGEDSRYYGPVKQSEIKGILIGLFRRGGI